MHKDPSNVLSSFAFQSYWSKLVTYRSTFVSMVSFAWLKNWLLSHTVTFWVLFPAESWNCSCYCNCNSQPMFERCWTILSESEQGCIDLDCAWTRVKKAVLVVNDRWMIRNESNKTWMAMNWSEWGLLNIIWSIQNQQSSNSVKWTAKEFWWWGTST